MTITETMTVAEYATPVGDRIVVGIDESPLARRALEWAIEEAQWRHGRCHVIEVWPHGLSGLHDPSSTRPVVDARLSALVDDVCSDLGATPMTEVALKVGDPLECLAEAARHADLMVVGSRGHGALKDLFLGSVSAGLLHLGICPTVVVPQDADSRGRHDRVVVGVDGSEEGARAMRWAKDEALLRHAELVVLHAWHLPVAMSSPYAPTAAIPFDECQQSGQARLNRAVRFLEAGPDLVVVPRLVEGRAEHELVRAAGEADLLVVGSRGHGEMAATVLGSTSRGCVHHAPCPVAIIP